MKKIENTVKNGYADEDDEFEYLDSKNKKGSKEMADEIVRQSRSKDSDEIDLDKELGLDDMDLDDDLLKDSKSSNTGSGEEDIDVMLSGIDDSVIKKGKKSTRKEDDDLGLDSLDDDFHLHDDPEDTAPKANLEKDDLDLDIDKEEHLDDLDLDLDADDNKKDDLDLDLDEDKNEELAPVKDELDDLDLDLEGEEESKKEETAEDLDFDLEDELEKTESEIEDDLDLDLDLEDEEESKKEEDEEDFDLDLDLDEDKNEELAPAKDELDDLDLDLEDELEKTESQMEDEEEAQEIEEVEDLKDEEDLEEEDEYEDSVDILNDDYQQDDEVDNYSILSPKTADKIRESIDKLFDGTGAGKTIDSFVYQLLEPKLEQWLNDNLPEIVERVVTEEIRNIANKRR